MNVYKKEVLHNVHVDSGFTVMWNVQGHRVSELVTMVTTGGNGH